MKVLLISLLFSFSLLALDYGDPNKLYYTSVRDIALHSQNENAKNLAEKIIKLYQNQDFIKKHFSSEVSFSINGPSNVTASTKRGRIIGVPYEIKSTNLEDTIYGVEITNITEEEILLQTIVHQNNRFYVYLITIPNTEIIDIEKTNSIAAQLSNFTFEINVGLIQHKAIVTGRAQTENGPIVIKKVYPIAVGALDNGGNIGEKYRIMTPTFKNHYVTKWTATYSRVEPWYFRAMPFILVPLDKDLFNHLRKTRIRDALKDRTGVGFHRVMNFVEVEETNKSGKIIKKKNYSKPMLFRGFDSHGCMRMQFKDLYEFYALITKSANVRYLVNISYRLEDLADSPYPMYYDQHNVTKRIVYKTIKTSRARGKIRPGSKVVVGNYNSKNFKKYGIINKVFKNTVQYIPLSKFDTTITEDVTLEQLAEELAPNFGNISSIEDAIISEQDALDWLYQGLEPTELKWFESPKSFILSDSWDFKNSIMKR